ncbi:hypothetical protein HMPREF1548_03327 [Clostridium sp. KLE 1755]|nr:hypothetical protein HMPREF1548_03327 [Clostridium sp. KLE 1755]
MTYKTSVGSLRSRSASEWTIAKKSMASMGFFCETRHKSIKSE